MEKINSVIPDNTNENLPETTISEVLDSLKKLGDDAREALEYLDGIDPEKLPFLVGLETGVAESREDMEKLFSEEEKRLAEKARELLDTTGEEEIQKFAEKCGLSLNKLGLKFPESSEANQITDGWSKKTVNLKMIDGNPSSVTAETHVSLEGMFPKIYGNFSVELETKPLVKERGPSVEFRITGNNKIDGEFSMGYPVILFKNTEKIPETTDMPDRDVFLETSNVGGIVLRPDGSVFSVFFVVDEKENQKHVLSADADFNDSLEELEGVLGKYGIYVDCIPPVIDIAESFNNVARGHMGGEHLISVVPKNLFKYEGGLLKDDGKRFDAHKIWNLLEYDMRREIDKINHFIEKDIKNPEPMLIIEYKSMKSEMEIYESATNLLHGDLSPDSIKSFASWISLSFSRETGGKDVTTTPEDDSHLSKTEQDLVKLFALVKSNLPNNL